jgi:hypothetical protein
MEQELLVWLWRRWVARPWVILGWVVLALLGGLAPQLSGLGLRSESVSAQQLMPELVFLWSLLGGLLALGALGEIEPRVESLPGLRRWRVRGFVCLITLWLPILPFLGISAFLSGWRGPLDWLLATGAVLAQMNCLVLVVDRIPWQAVRSIAFSGLAWWLPALFGAWPLAPGRWLQARMGERLERESGLESSVWLAWVGSMLALVFAAIAVDRLRRPHHEVRHPR